MKVPVYTDEKLAEMSREKLESLLTNARRLGAAELIQRCEAQLASRPSQRKRAAAVVTREHAVQDVVTEYHFVCSADRGVSDNGDGTFWSGAWVVALTNVKRSLEFGSRLALHEAKREPSYRQGQIIGYRLTERSMIDKAEVGVDFHVRSTSESIPWQGGGSGEKGYLWNKPVAQVVGGSGD